MLGIGYDEYMKKYGNNLADISKHNGYKKLRKLLSESALSDRQKKILLSQYRLLIAGTIHGLMKSSIVESYIINNYPEIVTCYDIIIEDKPYHKFIWTFKKIDERLVDKSIEAVGYGCKKYYIQYNSSDFLVCVINCEINCDSKIDLNQMRNKEADRVRKYGYELFNELGRRMVKHGMCWYTFGHPDYNFSDSSELFPVRSIKLEDEDDGWTKIGYRDDLDHAFRSTWEANIARILNFKNIKWKYEPYFVNLELPERMKRKDLDENAIENKLNYLPDFELENGALIEVKGFWDSRSKLIISQFMEQYSEKSFIVVDTDIYRCLNEKYKDIIPYWETEPIEPTRDKIQVVGITLPQRKNYVSALNVGDTLNYVREPDNPFDKRAIRVNDLHGNQVGYFAKDCNCIYAPKMDMGFIYDLELVKKEAKVLQCKIKLHNIQDNIIPEIFEM